MSAKKVIKWFINDFENQNHEWYGSLASPNHPDNYIVATGWCINSGEIKSEYFYSDEEAIASRWIDELVDCDWYVAHNATFEIQWMLRTYPEQFLAFVRKGGRIFCTQYAEYILSHQLELYPDLESCAIKYGGTPKVDAVKLLWEQGVLTADIDQALLMEYLADPQVGDIANTRRVCFAQIKQLVDNGMFAMFTQRMDSLLFNAIATANGLYVDQEVAMRNMEAQLEEINAIQSSILAMLPADKPEELEFSFSSDYHLSAFLFGGALPYRKKISYDPPKYEKVDCYQYVALDDGCGTEYYVPLSEVDKPENARYRTGAYSLTRFQRGKNAGEPKIFKIDSDVEKLKWGDFQFHFKGLINFDELPDIVSEAYIGENAEFRGKRNLVDGTPVYSTGKDSLDALAHHNAYAKPLKLLNALLKDTGTYYIKRDENGNESGMLKFLEPNSIIHHQLNNCATVTGRLSGSKPNMQNIPRDGTSKVKEMFSSRFQYWVYDLENIPPELVNKYPLMDYPEPPEEGMVLAHGYIVEVDYSALEVVTLASISGDTNLMRMLVEGIDMHCYRLAAKLGEDYESVFEKCNNRDHPDHKIYKQMRTDIKPLAFAHQYGASAHGIAFSTGCTVEEAEEFKRIEFELFPESNEYPIKYVRPMVEETGLKSLPVREQLDNGQWNLYRRGYFQAKSGTCYSFRQYPKKVRGQTVFDYKDTQVANYWCQGEASFIVQAACGRVIRELILRRFADDLVLPINTVHDAIYLDCASEALAKEYGALTRDIMEATPKALAELIPALKEWNYHITPFPAAAEYGKNMMSKNDVE